MKKRILVVLAIVALVGLFTSCSTVQDCPALSQADQNQTEQPA